MIKDVRFLYVVVPLALLLAVYLLYPIHPEDPDEAKAAAVAAMLVWLKELDDGNYAQSWQDTSPYFFQRLVKEDDWVNLLNRVRQPLGACKSRTLTASLYQTQVPGPTGPQSGESVIAKFRTYFDNVDIALEIVCFAKESNGTWKAVTYYVKSKPKSIRTE